MCSDEQVAVQSSWKYWIMFSNFQFFVGSVRGA